MKTVMDSIGMDLGIRRPATCSNGLKIEVLDLTFEEEKIALYQKQMSKRKPMSRRYKIAQNRYGKWQNKKINKKNDYYHKKTHKIVKNHNIIALERNNKEISKCGISWPAVCGCPLGSDICPIGVAC